MFDSFKMDILPGSKPFYKILYLTILTDDFL